MKQIIGFVTWLNYHANPPRPVGSTAAIYHNGTKWPTKKGKKA